MSPKIKTYLVYSISFLVLFMGTFFITKAITNKTSVFTTMLPIIVAVVLAPKPHVAQYQSGKRYGLKWIFKKDVWWF